MMLVGSLLLQAFVMGSYTVDLTLSSLRIELVITSFSGVG